MSEPGTAPWRRAEASRLIEFGRAAALPGGGFGWLGVNGEIDVTQPCPLYVNSRMTYVFALAHLNGVAGADALAASGLGALVGRYADGEYGGWVSSLDLVRERHRPRQDELRSRPRPAGDRQRGGRRNSRC